MQSDALTEVVLRFGTPQMLSTTVTTRQTMPNVAAETHIYNLYVFVFNSAGNKIYGHYFDTDNDSSSAQDCINAATDTWYISNPTANDSQDCWGLVKIFTSNQTDCKIFAIANIDSKMVNVSPEKLGLVQTQDDVLTMVATLNQEFIERTGYFPMSGYLTGINTGSLNHTASTADSASLKLERMDAKVAFWFKAGDKLSKLEINSWRVVNVPHDTYVMSKEARKAFGVEQSDSQLDYFDTNVRNYESEAVEGGKSKMGFSFYMLDNALEPIATPAGGWSYKHRSEQTKDANNKNLNFKYANPNSAYIEVSATVIMNTEYDFNGDGVVDDADTFESHATLNGDVKYIIHLGDFGSDSGNFDTLRNTSYTYNITVNGVNDIRVEVEKWNPTDGTAPTVEEREPGATGEVTVAMYEIFECDAHYDAHVITFYRDYIKDYVTWYVRTPFSETKNTPDYDINGTPITSGLDFRWVEFRINDRNSDGTYSDNKQVYKPHPTAKRRDGTLYEGRATGFWPGANSTGYVDELVEMLRAQKRLYLQEESNGVPQENRKNLFDANGELKVTAFVNEYYYDRHPLTGETIDSQTGENPTWRRVLNHLEPRVMHILSDTQTSADGESKVIGSAFSIRQKAIQTVYNFQNDNLKSAWGNESVDETEDSAYDYYLSAANANTVRSAGNTSDYNGRTNSLKEWDLVSGGAFTEGVSWSDYVNNTGENGSDVLVKKNLRYSCMTRNRDNDGDGVIDADEIRWYMASIKQLSNLWLGERSVSPAARLYQRNAVEKSSADAGSWRQHVLSSTASGTNSNNPQLIWAEEGSATGTLYNSYQWAYSVAGGGAANRALPSYSVRCVRNLNMDDNYTDLSDNNVPTDIVKVTDYDTGAAPTSSSKRVLFDMTFLDQGSRRYYIGENSGVVQDLVFNDEHSLENCVFDRFVVATGSSKSFGSVNFQTFNDHINQSGSSDYCPEGYRVPNQREIALMHMYISDVLGNTAFFCRTYYSFGFYGATGIQKASEAGKYGYMRSDNIFMVAGDAATTARCVRDLKQGEVAPDL